MDMQSISTSPQRSRSSECERVETDEGYTLIEMLIAIILMGTVVLSIMGGMWAVVRASAQSDERAKVQAILGSAGDALTNYGHINCPEPDDDQLNTYLGLVQKGATTVGWSLGVVQITDYQFYNPATGTWDQNNSVQGTQCDPGAGLTPEKTMQKMTITVTSPTGQYVQSVDIVKVDIRPKEIRDETAP